MNFIWLDDFLVLVTTGDFSRAAEERHIPMTAFSRRIRALEEWFGTDSVDLSMQPMILTSEGKRFVEVAQDLIARAAQFSKEARETADESTAILRMASTHALSWNFLPHWLPKLGPASLTPILRIVDTLDCYEALMQQGKVQFVLSHSHPQAPGLLHTEMYKSIVIGHDELIPVTQPNDEGLPKFALNGLGGGVEILAYSSESGLGRIHAAVVGHLLEGVTRCVTFTAYFASVLRSMASAGRGLAGLPRSLVQDDLNNGVLVLAGEGKWAVPLEIRIYRACLPLPSSAEAFWHA